MKVFVISDTHFGHKNIIDYCNRPFKSVEGMDEAMIKNWNETVSNNDVVIHLGDLGLGKKEYIADIVKRLNGKKILIMGNHDNWSEQTYRDMGFHTVSRFPILYADFYLMSHAPIQDNTGDFIQIFGHVHDKGKDFEKPGKSFCCSVENIQYTPIELTKIEEILRGQEYLTGVLKAKDVMRLLNITRPTLCKYLKTGKITAVNKINGQYMYNAESVYKLLK